MPDRVTLTERRMRDLVAAHTGGGDVLLYDAEVNELAVRLRGSSPRWYVQKWVGGRQHRVALGTWPGVPVELARELARERLVQLARGQDPVALKAEAAAKAKGGKVPINEVLERHLEKLTERGRSSRHVGELGKVVEWASAAGVKDLAAPNVAAKAAKWLADLDVSPITKNRYRSHLIALGKTAVRWWPVSVLPREPFLALTGSGARLPMPTVFTPDEAAVLVSDATLNRIDLGGPLWAFLLYTGCRFREGAYARWDRIDLDKATFSVIPPTDDERAGGEAVKRNKSRTVSLQPELVALLREWRKPTRGAGFVFDDLWRVQNHRWNVEAFRASLAACNIPLEGRKIHSLRHTHACIAIASGEDGLRLRLSMGHAGDEMAAHYGQQAMRWRGMLGDWGGAWKLRDPAEVARLQPSKNTEATA